MLSVLYRCAIVGRWCWKWLKENISGKSFLIISVLLALAQKMSKLLQFSIKVSNISQNILNITCFPILWGRSMDKFHWGNSVKLKLKVKLKQSWEKNLLTLGSNLYLIHSNNNQHIHPKSKNVCGFCFSDKKICGKNA